jgi:hypothetical protein
MGIQFQGLKIFILLCLSPIVAISSFADTDWEDRSPPEDSDFDWIQLKSGEWLKGDLEVIYDFVIEFDSEELDLLKFKFDDVKQLRTRNPQVVRFQQKWWSKEESQFRGRLIMKGDDLMLKNGDEERHFKRDELIAVVDGVKRRQDYWSGFFSVGINARTGNSETVDATFMANLKRRQATNRLIVDYVGNFSEEGELQSENNHRVNVSWDWFLTTKFFWRTVEGEYYRDPFSNIDQQYSVGTGLGYDLISSSKTEWEITLGGGYQNQEFVSVATNEESSVSTLFLMTGTRFDTEISDSVDFLLDYSLRILNKRSGTFTHHSLAKISTEFIGDLGVDISLIWDHVQTPQEADDGMVPEQDDFKLVFSLAYDF